MTKYKEWNLEPIDLLVGGTPCQSFSVAGLRRGLEDPRGNLALVYCGLLDHYKPKWFVWENVPGVLSSNGGRDFGSFLGALAELGYGFAYRVFDAQYFGVAQRRRRVFVVGYLGDWRPAAEVLFESDCMRRDNPPSRETRETTTGTTTNRLVAFGEYSTDGTASTMKARDYKDATDLITVYETHPMDSRIKEMGETCQTVSARWGTGGGNVPIASDSMRVRRLTPIECERLQGFPDDYTNIKEKTPDGSRYKALGNSMAVPVMKWIGQRINAYAKT
jgi:DNA (cytosine-5)-methyltransferase 1